MADQSFAIVTVFAGFYEDSKVLAIISRSFAYDPACGVLPNPIPIPVESAEDHEAE
jgi:hypothetical protein